MKALLAVLLVVLAGCASSTDTSAFIISPTPNKPVQGCTVVVDRMSLSAFYEPLLIIGEREGVNEDGLPVQEWWVWFFERPVDDYKDTNGNLRAINVPKYKVLLRGERRQIGGTLRKCPYW